MLPRKITFLVVLVLATGGAVALGLWTKSGRKADVRDRRLPVGGLECGHWAVYRACELMGVPVSRDAVRKRMPVGPQGNSLKEIADTLRDAGMVTRGRREVLDSFLAGEGVRIVHVVSPEHFIVVVRSDRDRVFYLDHNGRRQVMPASSLQGHWSGNVLHVERPPQGEILGFEREETPPGPRIQFDTLFIDKGDLLTRADSAFVSFEFPFRNLGRSDLRIKKIHTDCTCLLADKPEQSVGPGQDGVVKLQYRLTKTSGAFHHEAVVETDDPKFPNVILRTAGNTNVLVTASPMAIHLGKVPLGSTHRSLLFVRYSGEERFEVQGAKSDLGGLALTVHRTATEAVAERLWPRSHGRAKLDKDARVIEVDYTPDRLGALKGEVVVETGIERFETIRVPVLGEVVPPVSATPSLVSFGEISTDAASERSLVLTSALSKPFQILSVAPDVAGLRWTTATRDGGVELRLAATGVAAHKLSGTGLTIKVEHAGDKFDLLVPVFAAMKPTP